MKDTEMIRIMTDFIVNCDDREYISKKAQEHIDQITNRMDREAETTKGWGRPQKYDIGKVRELREAG